MVDPAPISPADRNYEVSNIAVNVYRINGTTQAQDVTTQVTSAFKTWRKKIKGLNFTWDGTVNLQQSCDPVQYPQGCDSQHETSTLLLNSSCTETTSLGEFRRRFGKSKGLQFVFTGTIEADRTNGNPIFPLEAVPNVEAGNCLDFGNLIVLDSQANGLIAAHGVGHAFSLPHYTASSANENLMCGPDGTHQNVQCPDTPNSKTKPEQDIQARDGLTKWE